MVCGVAAVFFFFKQKTAYEMRISDWSSDVCSSDLRSVSRFIQSPLATSVTPPTNCGWSRPSMKIGRASCRERVCQYVSISVVAVSLKKKKKPHTQTNQMRDNKTKKPTRNKRL